MKKKTAIWLPFIIAISIVLGICIGRFYHQASTIGSRIFAKQNKIETLLSIIQSQYVDTVNINKLVENAMPKIIGELDPHSAYIPAKDLLSVNEELQKQKLKCQYPQTYKTHRQRNCLILPSLEATFLSIA